MVFTHAKVSTVMLRSCRWFLGWFMQILGCSGWLEGGQKSLPVVSILVSIWPRSLVLNISDSASAQKMIKLGP